MALDWSNRFTKLGLRKRTKAARDEFPSKTYMNMVLPDAQEQSKKRIIVTAIPIVIALALFGKFGVYDFYVRLLEKNLELSNQTETLSGLEQQLVGYDELLEEYHMYEAVRMTTDASDVAAVDALALIDDYVAPVAHVDSAALGGGALTLNLSDISLDATGGLVSTLYEQKIVSGVQVATATNGTENNAERSKVTMTITLRSEAAAEAAELEAANAADAAAEESPEA